MRSALLRAGAGSPSPRDSLCGAELRGSPSLARYTSPRLLGAPGEGEEPARSVRLMAAIASPARSWPSRSSPRPCTGGTELPRGTCPPGSPKGHLWQRPRVCVCVCVCEPEGKRYPTLEAALTRLQMKQAPSKFGTKKKQENKTKHKKKFKKRGGGSG